MKCNRCGTENNEGAVYCKQCGKRIDGNVACPSCGTLIPNDSVYCGVCGSRADGKRAFCGTLYAGGRCPSCGMKPQAKQTEEKLSRGKRAAIVCACAFALSAVCFALLFSFLIGVTGEEMSGDIWYFFGKGYSETAEFLAVNGPYSNYFGASQYLPLILGTLVAAVTLAGTFSFAVAAAVSCIRRLTGAAQAKFALYSAAAVCCYLFGVCAVYALYDSAYTGSDAVSASVTLNAATKAGVVLSALLLGCCLVCMLFAHGKNLFRPAALLRVFGALAAVVLLSLAVKFACSAAYSIDIRTASSLIAADVKKTVGYPWMLFVLAETYEVGGEEVATAFTVTVLAQIVQFILIALLLAALVQAVRQTGADEKEIRLSGAVSAAVAAIVYLVLTVTACKLADGYAGITSGEGYIFEWDGAAIGYTPAVAVTVLSVTNLILTIAAKAGSSALPNRANQLP